MALRAEASLQQEIFLRLRAGGWPVIACPIPNGIWLGGKTPADRIMAARIIGKMKAQGMLVPGMPDLCVLWAGGGGAIELKRPKSRDLFRTRPAGRPNDAQIELAERATELGINHAYCSSWQEVRDRLVEWGAAS